MRTSLSTPMAQTSIEEIQRIHDYFANPTHAPNLFFASDKTAYVWRHMSSRFATDQIPRDGPIHMLPERVDPVIGGVRVEFADGTVKSVDARFNSSTMDALLVLHGGRIVFERYKTMRPFDQHNWFSCSKTIVGTSLARTITQSF